MNISINIIVIGLIIFLIILFFSLFFYYLFTQNNELIKYRVIKDPIEYNPKKGGIYKKLRNKYNTSKCTDICNKDVCIMHEAQLLKYKLCKECKNKFKCYDPLKGICVNCDNYNTCDELYGCYNKPPINPRDNLCTPCWIK
jgi:hypothetical protein